MRTFRSATRAERDGERGLSLIETLVMIGVLAVVAGVVLDFVGGASRRALMTGDSVAQQGALSLAEDHWRALVSGGRSFSAGDRQSFILETDATTVPCASWPTQMVVQVWLQQEAGGLGLWCSAPGGVATRVGFLPSGSARFSYSADGLTWTDGGDSSTRFIRLDGGAERAGGRQVWVERMSLRGRR